MVLSNRWSPEQVRNNRALRLTAPFLATPLWSQGSFVSLPRCARQSKSTSCANGKHLAGSEMREKGVRRCAISGADQRILAYRGGVGFGLHENTGIKVCKNCCTLCTFCLRSGYCSGVTVHTISRSRGPSNSIRTTRCHVPSKILPLSNGSATDVPMRAERM